MSPGPLPGAFGIGWTWGASTWHCFVAGCLWGAGAAATPPRFAVTPKHDHNLSHMKIPPCFHVSPQWPLNTCRHMAQRLRSFLKLGTQISNLDTSLDLVRVYYQVPRVGLWSSYLWKYQPPAYLTSGLLANESNICPVEGPVFLIDFLKICALVGPVVGVPARVSTDH